MDLPQIVVGSGPAGVSCAVALLARGHQVWMVDGGAQLEPEKAQKLVELRQEPPQVWPGKPSLWMREGTRASVKGLLKLTYGSDFPYRAMTGSTPMESEGVYVQASMGKGGLSAAWGTAIMPYRQNDMDGWPLTAKELEPHYRAVLDFMPVAQGSDGLEEDFPTLKVTEPMPLGPQGRQLWDGLEANQAELKQQGVKFGRSRLAINRAGVGAPGPCMECALCMYGCPYGLLYSSAQTVDALCEDPAFRYLPGYAVQRVDEREDHVEVSAIRPDGSTEVLKGERVFLGAGVLASAAIVLRSLNAYDRPVTFRDSHYFMLPMLRLRGAPGFERGNLQTMAQIFIEVMDKQLSRYTTHMQVYTYNDLFEQPIRQMFGPLAGLFPWKAFLSRMTLVQAYLHSSDSPGFVGTLEREGNSDRLRLTAVDSPKTAGVMKRFMKKLWSIQSLTGLIPLTPMLQPGEPGRGFHTGGTFPMAAEPVGFQSDLLGRPAKMQRTHLVDASVLPSIAATTITYTVMANAHRIGTLAGSLAPGTMIAKTKAEETKMPDVCAVTGAAGYVGSRIASGLRADWDVVPMGRSVGEEGIRWTFDGPSVESELRARGVAVLVHSAWDFRHPKAKDNWQTNVEGSRRLIAAAQAAGVKRIIFISTISAFEGVRSEYGKSKLAVEKMVLAAGGTVIRPGLVWGDRPGGMFGSLKQQVSKGKVVPMIGDGKYQQYLLHEDDLADVVRRAANPATADQFAGRVLTVANPQGWLLRDLILGAAQKEGKTVKLVGLPWRFVYTALKTAETLGLKMDFRSDSLISLIYQDRNPQFSADVPVRPFALSDIR